MINKLNFEIELYRSQLSVSQMLSQDKISAISPLKFKETKALLSLWLAGAGRLTSEVTMRPMQEDGLRLYILSDRP